MKEVNVEELWESNTDFFEPIKGAVLISAFIQSELIRLYFLKDGKIYRVKLPRTYFGRFELKQL